MGGLFEVIFASIDPSQDRTRIVTGDQGWANISATASKLSIQTTVENWE